MGTAHLNSDALRALTRASGAQRQEVALLAGVSPSAFTNYLTGLRTRTTDEIRNQLAAALSHVLEFPVAPVAITCHCNDPVVHQEQTGA